MAAGGSGGGASLDAHTPSSAFARHVMLRGCCRGSRPRPISMRIIITASSRSRSAPAPHRARDDGGPSEQLRDGRHPLIRERCQPRGVLALRGKMKGGDTRGTKRCSRSSRTQLVVRVLMCGGLDRLGSTNRRLRVIWPCECVFDGGAPPRTSQRRSDCIFVGKARKP